MAYQLKSSGKQQHVFTGERLATFSDAVFSIIATFSVIPLKFDYRVIIGRGRTFQTFNLEEYLLNQWPRYIVYLYSFALVADVWFIHSGIFSIIENVDDSIIWLNLFLLFVVSFVPYATGLISTYATSLDAEQIVIAICAGVIALFSIILILILLRAFKRQSLLHPSVADIPQLRVLKLAVFGGLLIQPLLSVVAIGFSWLTDDVPWLPLVLFYCILPVSLLGKLFIYLILRFKKSLEHLPSVLFKSIASKCRAEAFSDGVFAIVATLIVLDLTTAHIPILEDDEAPEFLKKSLFKQRFVFLSYITTFLITGLLWFVQYSMFHFIKEFTPFLALLNILTLFLVGGIPFVSEILSVFSDETNGEADELRVSKVLGVRVFCVLIVLAGLLQLLFWSGANCNKKHCMTEEIDEGIKQYLVLAKALLVPITGCLVYFCTFNEAFIDLHLYTVASIVAPAVCMILLQVIKCIPERLICGAKSRTPQNSPKRKTSSGGESPLIDHTPLLHGHKLLSINSTQDHDGETLV